ncbi:hypothetical protein [Phormidium sp. FACHB-1136]|nr:hypothetical protein [Phormidium sp. FACHB-1136]
MVGQWTGGALLSIVADSKAGLRRFTVTALRYPDFGPMDGDSNGA